MKAMAAGKPFTYANRMMTAGAPQRPLVTRKKSRRGKRKGKA